jgi:hypothetical protein
MKRPTDEQIRQAQREADPLPWTYWAVWAVVLLATFFGSILFEAGLEVLP